MIRCSAGPRGAFAEGAVVVLDDEHAAQLVEAGAAVVLEQVVERAVARPQAELATANGSQSSPPPPAAETEPSEAPPVVAPADAAPRVRPPRRR